MTITDTTPTCTSVFSSVTLTCTYNTGTRLITIEGMFPSGNSDGQYGIVI